MNSTLLLRSSLFPLLGAALVLSACPQVPPADPLEPAPAVTAFTSSAYEVPVGATVKLTWTTTNATSVKIDELKLGSISGVSGAAGEVDVAITGDSLFVLTARNERGASDTAVVSVRVGAAAGELLFTSLPDTINAGEAVTLAWSAPGATTVTINATPGGAIDLMGQTSAGSVTVRPTANTTYTLTSGVRSATTSVTVRPSLLSFTASDLSADAGAMVTLSWTTANATRVQLSAPGRGTLVDEMDAARVASGSFADTLPTAVDPGQLFSYQLTVTGPATTLTDSVVVSINGSPAIVTFTAPTYARMGSGTVALAWETRQADEVSISADGVEVYRAPSPALAANGSLTLPAPGADAVYTLTARSSRGGQVTQTRNVDVVGTPTVSLMATPAAMVSPGSPVALAWTGTNIRKVTITEPGFGTLFSSTGALDTGTQMVLPTRDTTYTITADNSFGDRATATASVTVNGAITLVVSEPGTLRTGQNVSVSWAADGGTITGLGHDSIDTRGGSTGFEDIAADGGTRLDFATTGNIVATIDTPFRTSLFGHGVGETITVSRYGYLTFGEANGANSVDEAFPTSKLEPYSVAPYWESLTLSGVYWQVKPIGGVDTLIVQWVNTTANFEEKISATGQIDFEYRTVPSTVSGRAAVTGANRNQFLAAPTAAANQGITFFGPRPSPVTMRVHTPGPIAGHITLPGGAVVRIFGELTAVTPSELIINEVLRDSTVGVNGQWAELRNARDTAVDLAGWSFAFADGGSVPLSGTVPPRGVLVVGASTDRALNDDAGVQVAIPNFDLTGQSVLNLSRGGTHGSLSLTSFDAGVAVVNDVGPYRGTAGGRCAATAGFGAQSTVQRGTPGLDTGCAFPYALASATPGYFDISATGTPLGSADDDDEITIIDLSSAPVPFFGVARARAGELERLPHLRHRGRLAQQLPHLLDALGHRQQPGARALRRRSDREQAWLPRRAGVPEASRGRRRPVRGGAALDRAVAPLLVLHDPRAAR